MYHYENEAMIDIRQWEYMDGFIYVDNHKDQQISRFTNTYEKTVVAT